MESKNRFKIKSPEKIKSGRTVDNVFPNLLVTEKFSFDKYKRYSNHAGKTI